MVVRRRPNALYESLYLRYRHVVVIAPAGAGKTVQAQLFAQHAHLPLAWLSLRETDATPSRLLNSMASALGPFGPTSLDELRSALRSDFTAEEAASVLARMVGPQNFLFVLDQCESVLENSEASVVLSTFAEYAPPNVLLMSLSRTEPPGAVRLGVFEDSIGIVTGDDLRLTPEEATEVIVAYGGDGSRTAELLAETSGWMAGAVFASRRDSLGQGQMDLAGYIRSEILGQLPEDEKQFLLDSSVLDVVSAETAEALVGRDGRRLYEQVRGRHLPATTMTPQAIVYHSVLKTVLRSELIALDPDREPALLRRSAEHLVTRHHEEEATELFLDLGDLDRAAETACGVLAMLFERADWGALWRWLELLGDERVATNPRLVAAKIRTLYGLRRFGDATDLIRHLDQRGQLRAATVVDPGLVATMGWALQADPSESRRILDRYEGDYRSDAVRFMLDTDTGLSAATPPQMSDWGEFDRVVTWALILQGRLAEAARMVPKSPDAPVMNPNVVLSELWRGDFTKARDLWDRVPHEIRERPHSLFIEACIFLAEDDTESAVAALEAAVAGSRKTGFPLDPLYEVYLAFVLLVIGRDEDAIGVLKRHLDRLAGSGQLALVEWVQVFLGLGYLKAGSPEQARLILDECVRSMERAKRRLLLPLASSCLAEAEACQGDPETAHEHALLASHTASLTGGFYWLTWGVRFFPAVRARELARSDVDARWRRILEDGPDAPRIEHVAEVHPPIRLYLQPFGPNPDILVNDEPKRLGRLKLLELVACMSLHPNGVDRNQLQQKLFPDSDQRRGGNHFRQITHKLRAATGVSLTRFGGSKVTWPANVIVDTADLEFERLARPGTEMVGQKRTASLHEAAILSGSYLERSDLAWADERRYELDVLREEVLLELATMYLDEGEFAAARDQCEVLLELDPYNESSYQLMIKAEKEIGTHTSCLAVYRRAVGALRELGLTPTEQTAALVGEIRPPSHTRVGAER